MLTYPIPLVNSIVDVKMVSTRKKRWQNKRLFSQLSDRDTDIMIGQNNQNKQVECREDVICRGTSLGKVHNPTQVNYPQVDVHTLEEKIVNKVRSEVDFFLASVETGVQDAVLTAIEKLVIPRVELAVKTTN